MTYGLVVMTIHNLNLPVKKKRHLLTSQPVNAISSWKWPSSSQVFVPWLPMSVSTAFPSSQPAQAKVLESQVWECGSLQPPALPAGQTAGSLAMWFTVPFILQPLTLHSKHSKSSRLSTGCCVLGILPSLTRLAFLTNECTGCVPRSLLKLLIH